MSVKANESLFMRFKAIAADLERESSIVQNEQDLAPGDLTMFCNRMLAVRKEICRLTNDVLDHVSMTG